MIFEYSYYYHLFNKNSVQQKLNSVALIISLKNKIVKKVLEESFNDPNYVSLLNTLNVNDTNLIKDKVIKIESFLSTIPFYKDCINDFISKYDDNYYKDLYIDKVKEIMLSYKKLYEDIENELYNSSSDFDKLSINIEEEKKIITRILNSKNFDDLSSSIRISTFSRLTTVRGHSDDYIFNKYKIVRDNLKEEVTKKLSFLINIDDQEYKKEIEEKIDDLDNQDIRFEEVLAS